MIIDNNKVQGIYLYDPNIEFTKNDLVVSVDSIYVCDAEIIFGVDPAEDTGYEYYHPYPGSKIMSATEFFDYIESGEGGDKYISVQALKGILQRYQFGLSLTGVIEDYIDKNGDTSLDFGHVSDYPIDDLMLTETMNRGIIKVSHELNQIVDGNLNGIPFSTLFGYLNKTYNDSSITKEIEYQLILNQYTYKSSPTLFIRIQEMTSPLTGVSIYRYMSWNDGSFPSDSNVISDWRSVYSYSSAIMNKLSALDSYYQNLADVQRSKIDAKLGSFRFKEIGFSDNSIEVTEDGVYTICAEGTSSQGQGIITSDTIVVKVDSSSSNTIYFSLLSGTYITINAHTLIFNSNDSNAKLISVYGRDILSTSP